MKSSNPAKIDTPGAMATTASRSMMMPKDLLPKRPRSQSRVKWFDGTSSSSWRNTTEVGIGI
jgi:hypothetical protein